MPVKTLLWTLAEKSYSLVTRAGNAVQLMLLLFFRLNWGWQFFVTGRGKLTDHQQVVEFFTSLHLPAADLTAWFVGGVECVGGLLLIIGLAARPVGLILSVNMLVAYLSVDDDRQTLLNFFQDQQPFFAADPFFFLLTGLLSFAFGAGVLSFDAVIGRLIRKTTATAPTFK